MTTVRSSSNELLQSARSMFLFLLATVILWFLFDGIWDAIPYVRNGTTIILSTKVDFITRDDKVFPPSAANKPRVVFFGDSKVLSGFIPDEYDKLAGGRLCSYNLGMPGEEAFMHNLELMLEAGNIPTHVFLLWPWPPPPPHSTFWEQLNTGIKWISDNGKVVDSLFPFRELPRDLFTFMVLAHRRGGIQLFYDYSRASCEEMLADRGYYFIESQSHFPDHHLPVDFVGHHDDINRSKARDVVASGRSFDRLKQLAEQYNFKCYLVPSYYRIGMCAPAPPVNEDTAKQLEGMTRFAVVGPDYFQYSNLEFSDLIHVNPAGASKFTKDLWETTKHLFEP